MTVPELRSDCSSCFGLCCVLLPFSRESGFGVSKGGGTPCHHLTSDDACGIHTTLRSDGWPGCTVFECFGAGQRVSQVTYGGVSWREHDNLGEMAAVLSVMRLVHEMLAHLSEVVRRGISAARTSIDRLVELTAGPPEDVLALDIDTLRAEVGDVLAEASAQLRRRWEGAADHHRADLAGADLRAHDLRGAALRGAVLIGADLRGSDLTDADVLGADLRDAHVSGADLSGAIFLSQPQVNAMRGDGATRLPVEMTRPGHWTC